MQKPNQASNGSTIASRDKNTVKIDTETALDQSEKEKRGANKQPMNGKKKVNGTSEGDDSPKPKTPPPPKIVLMQKWLENRYLFRYNRLSNDVEIKPKDGGKWSTLNENNLIVQLLKADFQGVEKPLLALLNSDFVPKHCPIEEYFKGLGAWDGFDHIGQLAGFVKAKDPVWFGSMFKKHFVRTAACALGKTPFNKQCFVIFGKQNDGKTTFLRFLCPPTLKAYFKENPDLGDKDGRLALAQNLFINFDELEKFSKHDINSIKSFFTIETVKDRVPYGRKPELFRRVCSFLGSTNKREFLTDETGSVRWLVLEIDGVNHDNGGAKGYGANVDIDKVWGQVFHLLNNGFEYMMTREELEKSEANNQNFQVTTAEMELISQWFSPGTKSDIFVTATDIEGQLAALTNGKIRLSRVNIGRALTMLGFEQVQKYIQELRYPKKGYFVKQKFVVEPKDNISVVNPENVKDE